MYRFIAQLNDGSYINVQADRMKKEDAMIYAHRGHDLVAVIDISAVISAHVSERGERENGNKDN